MRTFTEVVAIVVVSCIALLSIIRPVVHLSSSTGSFYSERAKGAIPASSRTQLFDDFIQAHKFLMQNGFHPAAEPTSHMGMKSGLIAPDMITLYYAGSYQGSAPFGFRLDIDRSDSLLVPYVEASGSTKESYEAQEKAAHAFIDFFVEQMNKSVAAVDDHR